MSEEIVNHLAKASEVLGIVRAKRLRREALKTTKTSRLQLQDKRVKLAEQSRMIAKIQDLLAELCAKPIEKPRVTGLSEAEASRVLEEYDELAQKRNERFDQLYNLANIAGLVGYLEGLGLIVDCLSEEQECDVTKKDGRIVTGKRRISVAQDLAKMHDMLIDLTQTTEQLVIISEDTLKNTVGFGVDQHGVEIRNSPYVAPPEQVEPEIPVVAEGTADVVTDEDEEERLKAAEARVGN